MHKLSFAADFTIDRSLFLLGSAVNDILARVTSGDSVSHINHLSECDEEEWTGPPDHLNEDEEVRYFEAVPLLHHHLAALPKDWKRTVR